MSELTDDDFMAEAMVEAKKAAKMGEVPVGAVLVLDGAIIARGHNQPISQHDPTAHAEIVTMRMAAKQRENYRLNEAVLYVTLEPCAMCAGAISHARIARVVFAAEDQKGGAVVNGVRFFEQTSCHHRPDISSGPAKEQSATILRDFFKARRR
jgi:tRNA(adenine34) deaminase